MLEVLDGQVVESRVFRDASQSILAEGFLTALICVGLGRIVSVPNNLPQTRLYDCTV